MTRLLLAVGLTVIVGAATVAASGFIDTHKRSGAEPSGVSGMWSADAPPLTSSDGGSPETERATGDVPSPDRSHFGAVVGQGRPAAAPLPSETQQDDGGAVVGGLASFVGRSYGSRYLALPGGPGIRVTICAKRCVTRTSTDAGPSLARQREGRVADVSWSDFRWICKCPPEAVGLIVVSVQYDTLPATDTP